MKNLRYKIFLVFSLSLILPFLGNYIMAQSEKMQEIRVGIYNNQPKLFVNNQGEPDGIFVDIMEEIAENENLNLRYVNGDWHDLIQKLQHQEIDVLMDVAKSKSRGSIFKFNTIPVLGSWIEVFTRKDNRCSSVLELQNKKIGVLKGSVQDDFFQVEFYKSFNIEVEVIEYTTYSDLVNSLLNKQIDYIVASRFLYFNTNFHSKVLPTGIVFEPGELYFAFPQQSNNHLIELIDKNLVAMKNNPNSVYYKSLQKWMGKEYFLKISPLLFWLIISILSLLFLVSLFAVLLKYSVNIKTKQLINKNIELELERERAKEIENKLQIIANNLPNGMIYQLKMDKDGKRTFNYVSHACEKFYGYSPVEIMNDPNLIYNRTHPDDLPILNKEEIQSKEQLSLFNATVRCYNPDNTIRWSLIISYPRKIKDDIVWDGLELDITHQIETQHALEKAKEKAEESDKLKTVFLQNLSHEIRTPMNGILGFLELLNDPALDIELREQYFKIMNDSSQRLMSTINNIIEISRIETSEIEANLSRFNLHEIMNYYFNLFEGKAKEKNLNLIYNVLNPIDEIEIETDKMMFESVLFNLLDNGIKFTNKGFIEFGSILKESELIFYVKDSGIGFPKDRSEAIFEKFIQADLKITRPHEGAGLGLTIVKAYLNVLHGKIWGESEQGNGTVFYFSLPYFPKFKAMPEEDSKKTFVALQNPKPIDILVVEDDEDSHLYIQFILKNKNYHIFKAYNSVEALNLIEKYPSIKIILMDIKLPGVNGLDLTTKIRETNQKIKIIAQTAYAMTGDKEKAIEAGCNAYLSKPYTKDELLSIMTRYSE
jgi:signal transduction histidine kinase/ABC-type amino acid transport substrate-binding protein